jgi:hypothetical protein
MRVPAVLQNVGIWWNPSSVTFGDSFSQREKPLVRWRPKAFSLWEKVAAKRTDEGRARRHIFIDISRRIRYDEGRTF